MLKGSPGSGPARALKRMRRSATVRAMGPTTPIQPNELLLGGKWPAAGKRAGGGFRPQNAEEGRGAGKGPPPVPADPPKRAAGWEGRGFAATGAAARVGKIPGIACCPGEAIVGFVGHEEFGSVGGAEEDGAGGAESIDDGRGVSGGFFGSEKRACGIGKAC